MTTVDQTRDVRLVEILSGGGNEADQTPRWLRRVDDWATWAGDAVNPILVKETRQALKSRQFVVTFSLLLFAALAWTIVGSVMLMPRIYYSPSAPTLLIGYYVLLAVPMLLVVPLAAYRSLEAEVDEATLELLTITALSPRQIVAGKLASSALQMLLYFIVLFPCVAYAYTLRGVDLPTLGVLLGMLVLAGLTLTMTALFFAPVTPGRTGQISGLLAVLAILIFAELMLGNVAMELITYGLPIGGEELVFAIIAVVSLCLSSAAILLMATVAKLTPESENRSTGIRIAMLAHMLCVVAIAAYAILRARSPHSGPEDLIWIPMVLTAYIIGFWTLVGSMMAAESSAMTPRIRRELPRTFLGRLLLIWLTPGPATGLVFSVATLAVVAAVVHAMLSYLVTESGTIWLQNTLSGHATVTALVVAYLAFALVIVYVMVAFLRNRNPVKVPVGIAAMAVVLLLMAIVPYSIGLHFNDYRQYEYSIWQFTNWVWTIERAGLGVLEQHVFNLVIAMGAFAFLTHLLLLGRWVLPQRLATPQRVQEEYRRMAGLHEDTAQENDPLGLGTGAAKP
jgi:ABC-type transport system involved in cytochrome c biogenesis permease component